jgi:hypothetical protein
MQPQGQLDYLRRFPKLWKWMNRCAVCGRLGHKPDLPQQIGPEKNPFASVLRRFFTPLDLNEVGVCEQCAAANAESNKGTGGE